MTKAQLVTEIAIQTGYDKVTISNVIESAMRNVKKTVRNGEYVSLRGFGSFILKTRAQKTARNISNNTTVIIPEHRIVAFRPCPEFADAVREIEY